MVSSCFNGPFLCWFFLNFSKYHFFFLNQRSFHSFSMLNLTTGPGWCSECPSKAEFVSLTFNMLNHCLMNGLARNWDAITQRNRSKCVFANVRGHLRDCFSTNLGDLRTECLYYYLFKSDAKTVDCDEFKSIWIAVRVANGFELSSLRRELRVPFFFFTFYLQVWNRVPGTRRPHTRPDRITDEHVSCRLSIVFCVCVCVCLPLDFVSFVLLLFFFCCCCCCCSFLIVSFCRFLLCVGNGGEGVRGGVA